MKKKKSKNKSSTIYNSSEKKDILNRLGSVSKSTKRKIEKDSKNGQTFDSEETLKRDMGRNTNETILHYEIDDNDNIFINTIIKIINERKINSQWIYNRIYDLYRDECPTYEKARSTGYNFIYALTVKKELGIPRMMQWLEILNVKDFEISYKLADVEDDDEDYINEDDYDIDEDYEEE